MRIVFLALILFELISALNNLYLLWITEKMQKGIWCAAEALTALVILLIWKQYEKRDS